MKMDLIGVSQHIEQIRKRIDQVTDTDLILVVRWETGVGKEVVVRSLYQKSKHYGKAFFMKAGLKTIVAKVFF